MPDYPWNHDAPIESPLAATLFGLIGVVSQVSSVRYTALASLALLMYDHVITFDIEVERVWTLRWRLPKISFLINRYITPPMLLFNTVVLTLPELSTKFCGFWLQWQAWPTLIALATVELILIMRVSAIYNSKVIMYTLFGLYCCEVGSMLGLIGFLYKSSANPLSTPSYLPGCYSLGFVPWLYGYWVAPVILESLIIILTLFKSYTLMRDPIQGSPTLRLIARDSIVYFFIMFSILFSNLIIFKYAPPFISSLLIGPSSCIACVAVGRMMMNMRSLSVNDNATELDTIGTLAFRQRSYNVRSQRSQQDSLML